MSVSSAHAVTAGCTLYVSGDVGNDGNNSSGTGAGQAFRTVQGAEEWMEKFLTTKTTYTVPFQPTTGAYSAPYTRYTVNAPQKVCIVKSATPYDSLHIPSGLADAPNPNWPANSFEAYTLEIRVSGTPQFPVTFTAYDVANPPTIRQTGYSAIQIDSTANYINITNLILTGRSYEALAHKDSTGTPVALTRYNNGQLHPVDWTFYDGDCLFVKGNPLNYTQMQFQHDATQTDATKQSPFPVGVPTHIVVDSVKAYACGGGGFGTQSADWITSSNNTVYDNAWFGLYGGEGISLEYSVDSEVYPTRNGDSPATISSRLKNRVTGNYVFDNREYVPWRADKNGPHIDDGEGIVIDTNANNYPINRLDNTTATVQRYYGQTLIADNAIWK